MATVVLSLKNVSVVVEQHELVSDISFDVADGDITAIVGPNGGGKSTLVKAILNLNPYKGEIKINKGTTVGYVPQYFNFDRTTPILVKELFRLRLKSSFISKKNDKLIATTLENVGAKQVMNKRLGVLSGGEMQRVLIALALIDNPGLLILDEPSSGIDIGGEETIYNLIQKLSKERNMAIIFISHDLDIVYRFANQAICLNKKMLCVGPPNEVLTEERLTEAHGGMTQTFRHHRHAS